MRRNNNKRALTPEQKFHKQFRKLTDAGLILLQDAREGTFKVSDIEDYEKFMDCIREAIQIFINDESISNIDILVSYDNDDEDSEEDDCEDCHECDYEDCDCDCDEYDDHYLDIDDIPDDIPENTNDVKGIDAPKNSLQKYDSELPNDLPFVTEMPGNDIGAPISEFMFAGYTWRTFSGIKPEYCGNTESAKYPIFTKISNPQTGETICTACVCMRSAATLHTEIPHDIIRAYNTYVAISRAHGNIDNRYAKKVGNNMYAMIYNNDQAAKIDSPEESFITSNTIMSAATITVVAAYMYAMHISVDAVISNAAYRSVIVAAIEQFKKNFIANKD